MPAKQVTKDARVMIPGADVHGEEAAVQAAVDTAGQDIAPEALFASPALPVELPRPDPHAPPTDGTTKFSNNVWFVAADGTMHEYTGAMVEFVSKDPGLMIELGDVQVRFDLGRVKVPEPVADRLKRHFLYSTGKFFAADEVAVIGNEIVSYRDHKAFSTNVARMKSGEVVMFATKINPNLVMHFGDFEVRFEDGYAAVDPSKLARFEKHMFVREGRVIQLQAV